MRLRQSMCGPGRTKRARSCGLRASGVLRNGPQVRPCNHCHHKSCRSLKWRLRDSPTRRSPTGCSCRIAPLDHIYTARFRSWGSSPDQTLLRPSPRWKLRLRSSRPESRALREADQVVASQWGAHLLHKAALTQAAEVNDKETSVFEQRNDLSLGIGVVA